MPSAAALRGVVTQFDKPCWAALEQAVGTALAGSFMWMDEVRLNDGTRVHAYKHVMTRRYLHLAADGTALAWRADATYRMIDAATAIRTALGD